MKKKLIAVLTTAALSLSMLLTPNLIVRAAEGDVTINGEVIDLTDSTELTSEAYTGYLLSNGTTLVVTEVLTGYNAGIDSYPWYTYKDAITKVIITDEITTITNNSFNTYTSLKEVVMSNSVTDISSSAFEGCTELENLTLSNSVKNINNYAFRGCTNLMSVDLPSSLTSIGMNAFYGCSSLESIVIPDKLTYLDRGVFENCTGLMAINGGNSLTNIDSSAFEMNTPIDVTVTTSNAVLLNYNWSDSNINARLVEEDVERAIGTELMAVTGSVDNRVVTLDVTIPVEGIQFSIDGDGKLSSQGIIIKSNTTVPLTVNVLSVEREESGVDNEGVTTNLKAPSLVPVNTYTEDEWNNLGEYTTKKYIALAVKQVDVETDAGSNLVAGETLTEATVDEDKVETPVELGNLSKNNKLAHILSGYESEQSIGINIEKDKAYTNYGKEWIGSETMIFRYQITLEFSY